MIVFGPVMAVFCIGIFCLVMDIIYPTNEPEVLVPQKIAHKLSGSLLDYSDHDYEYNFEDNSELIND